MDSCIVPACAKHLPARGGRNDGLFVRRMLQKVPVIMARSVGVP